MHRSAPSSRSTRVDHSDLSSASIARSAAQLSHAEAMRPSSSAGRRGQGDEVGAEAMRGSPCCRAEARLLVTMAIPEVILDDRGERDEMDIGNSSN